MLPLQSNVRSYIHYGWKYITPNPPRIDALEDGPFRKASGLVGKVPGVIDGHWLPAQKSGNAGPPGDVDELLNAPLKLGNVIPLGEGDAHWKLSQEFWNVNPHVPAVEDPTPQSAARATTPQDRIVSSITIVTTDFFTVAPPIIQAWTTASRRLAQNAVG